MNASNRCRITDAASVASGLGQNTAFVIRTTISPPVLTPRKSYNPGQLLPPND